MAEKIFLLTVTFALLLLGESYQDDMCPRRDPSPGVLVLLPGSEVLLHCHGDVIVDRVLKVKGKTERPFIKAYQKDTGTTSDERFQQQTANTSPAATQTETGRTFTERTDVTPPGQYQKKTAVTSSDRYNDKKRKNMPGTYLEREGGRRSTKGYHRERGNSSEGYHERTGGKEEEDGKETEGEFQREIADVAETELNMYKPTVTTEAVTLVNLEKALSTTERPHMTGNTMVSKAVSKPLPQNGDTEEGEAVELKRQSYWTLNGVVVQDSSEVGALRLPHLGLMDVGNYSCYRRGVLMSSVKITLGTPPMRPTLSCSRRSLESKIRCYWESPQPVVPPPKCYILLEKSGQLSREMCSYSVIHARCWCVLDHEVRGAWGDNSVYMARLCVTNTAGNATSPAVRFTGQNSIRPDPPESLRASGVQGGERMLAVSWSYPPSWRRGFYSLRFQLRYRPSQGEQYQTVETERLYWTITDALPHTEYELQLRAIEEFNNGYWSDWTTPVYASTWTGLVATTSSDPADSLDLLWFYEGSGSDEEVPKPPVSDDPLSVFGSVFGICVLVIMVILLSAYVFRHRMRFASKLGKFGSAPASGDPSAARPQPALDEEKPLMSPVSPTPSQVTMQHHFPPVQEESIHFHNMGYFFVTKE